MGTDHFSASQINTYLMCPRKYRYRYIDKREPERRAAAMAFGSAVHTAIEWWGSKRIEGQVPDNEDTLRIFRADWSSQVAPGDLTFEGKQTAESLMTLGEQLVQLFIEHFVERPFLKTEERFKIPLVNEETGEELPIPLLGFMDFVEQEDLIGEIKTVAKKTDPNGYIWTVQLAAYAYSYRRLTGIEPRIIVVELLKTKTPRLEEFELTRSRAEQQWFVQLAFEVFRGIQRGVFFPNPSWVCLRCEFKAACHARHVPL